MGTHFCRDARSEQRVFYLFKLWMVLFDSNLTKSAASGGWRVVEFPGNRHTRFWSSVLSREESPFECIYSPRIRNLTLSPSA
jgi:hypothetical protein